jgi:hypothetical protein
MGLLDEAIREHLELKRRRGAEPSEVARLEREALGPVVRGEQPLAGDEFVDEAAPVAEPAAVVEPELAPAVDAHPPAADPESAPEPPPEAPAPAAHTGQPTEEFDAESAAAGSESHGAPAHPPAAEPESDHRRPADPGKPHEQGGDVLEETPDFLQETPEHDRLWFEQAPPQEFDFDK